VTAFAQQLIYGASYGMNLAVAAAGLALIFGVYRVINLAHGTLYMVGAYLALSTVRWFDSYWAALILAPIGVALIGAVFYTVLLRHMQRQSPMRQVLVTFGLIFVGFDAVRMIWGVLPHTIPIPEVLDGSVQVLGEVYPTYRLFIIAVGLAVLAALYFGLERTRLGAIVRAGVDDRTMVAALGIDVERAFFLVFCLGCWLAGLAGVVSAPVFSIFPGMDMSILILTLIVVVVGGPGSLKGAAIGSLVIGMVDTYGQVIAPEFARVTIYALMAVVLLMRPHGLFPVRRTH